MWMFLKLALVVLLLLFLGDQQGDAGAGRGRQPAAGCQARCGGVDIPYPFGIGNGCFLSDGFEISCSNDVPFLSSTKNSSIEVLSISVAPRPEAKVRLPVSYRCYNATGAIAESFYGHVDLSKNGVYRISDERNMFVVLGCNTYSYTKNGDSKGTNKYGYLYNTGCITFCNDSRSAQDGKCSGIGCCHVEIPPGLSDNAVVFSDWSHVNQVAFNPCDYSFLVDKDDYFFHSSQLATKDFNRTMPVWLDWAIRDANDSTSLSCDEAVAKMTSGGYACVSTNSVCVDSTNGPGYYCNCSKGYEGNPYVDDPQKGCIDINECVHPHNYTCYGVCNNTPGDYECNCRAGYQTTGDPKKQQCSSKFPLAAQLALGITLGVSLLIVALLLTLVMLQKRKLDDLFEKNGGWILKDVNGLVIFSKDELKKITNNYTEFLGKGSFGAVYKGTLPGNITVAVKASIKVNEDTKKEFAEEVKIQKQMSHTNILKLVGCCLEVDVPMLVYEFAAEGSLQNLLHGKDDKQITHLSLDQRLEIAIGSAEGLKYMHAYATGRAIRHGDVKPDNILLDDKLTPKISDFGLSKLLEVEGYFSKKVVGCMGYLDPMFMKTGLLTQKSDVYSFGAVLLELLTRKKIVYDGNRSLTVEFHKVYEKERSGRSMFDEAISTEKNIPILEDIGKLAIDCLKEDVEDRPDMTEVAEHLVMLRRARRNHGKAQNRSPHHFEDMAMDDYPMTVGADTSESSSATFLCCPPQPANISPLIHSN